MGRIRRCGSSFCRRAFSCCFPLVYLVYFPIIFLESAFGYDFSGPGAAFLMSVLLAGVWVAAAAMNVMLLWATVVGARELARACPLRCRWA